MPTTPRGLSSGNPKAACSPERRAIAARGKFPSSGLSTIHLGSPDSTTVPGRPSPGARTIRSLNASNSGAPAPACHVRTQRSRSSPGPVSHTAPSPHPSELPMTSRTASYASTGRSVSARIRATECSTRWMLAASANRGPTRRVPTVNLYASWSSTATTGPDMTTRRTLRIVVADDSALLREGIASLLEDAGHEVVGRSGSADDLLRKVGALSPDVAIVDVRMPPGNADDGLLAAVEIRGSHPDVAVLVLSQHLEPAYMLELVGDSASGVGYLLKDRVGDVSEFIDSVERVASGGTAFDPEVVKSLVAGRGRSSLDELTDRERSVLTLLAEGRSNRAIAKQVYLSSRAVERHVQAIFQKLGLPDSEDDNRRVLAVLALLGQ